MGGHSRKGLCFVGESFFSYNWVLNDLVQAGGENMADAAGCSSEYLWVKIKVSDR